MGLYALLMAMGPLAAAPDDEGVAREVQQAVHSVQTAFNKGDVETLRGLMTPDHVTILTYAHFSNAADQLKVLSDWRFSQYKMEGLKVRSFTPDVALVTYRATIEGTYKGKPVPSPVVVAEVWVKRDGKWLEASYQETPPDRR
jgi:uncharacterized protein (TIGR02246 family)